MDRANRPQIGGATSDCICAELGCWRMGRFVDSRQIPLVWPDVVLPRSPVRGTGCEFCMRLTQSGGDIIQRGKRSVGFTFVNLLVVIAIIGVVVSYLLQR